MLGSMRQVGLMWQEQQTPGEMPAAHFAQSAAVVRCMASRVKVMQLLTSEVGAALAEAAAGCSSFLAAPAGAFLGCMKANFMR